MELKWPSDVGMSRDELVGMASASGCSSDVGVSCDESVGVAISKWVCPSDVGVSHDESVGVAISKWVCSSDVGVSHDESVGVAISKWVCRSRRFRRVQEGSSYLYPHTSISSLGPLTRHTLLLKYG